MVDTFLNFRTAAAFLLIFGFTNEALAKGRGKARGEYISSSGVSVPESRPGIIVNADPTEGSCLQTRCVPICRTATKSVDHGNPDWGFEDDISCVIKGSNTHLYLPDGEVARGCKEGALDKASCYYQYPPRACTWPAPQVDFLVPPSVTVGAGPFTTKDDALIDPNGNPFLIRAMNNSHAWYDTCGQYMAFGALDDIAEQGANAVRVGWGFSSIEPVGESKTDIIGTTPELLAEIFHRIVDLEMIAILAVNDSTGKIDASWPLRMAQRYTEPNVKEVLLAYESFLIIGIANEMNISDEAFVSGYTAAILHFRENGINHPLLITSNEWGQGCQSIIDYGPELIEADPLHSIVFDIHMYNYIHHGTRPGGSAKIVKACLDDIRTAKVPLIIGEFGHMHGGSPVQWETIVSRAEANGQGYAPWLWFGDTEYPILDLNKSWDGPLTIWGSNVLPLNGVKATIFQ